MGTWRTFDVRTVDEEVARARIIDAALEAGANLFDTSPMYGEAERVLAGTLADRRDRAIIATKVWTESPVEGRKQVERALAWYGGYVDIYQIHNLVAWRQHLPVLEALRDEGRIGIIGATHYRREAFAELRTLMETGRIQQIQIPYNARDQMAARAILPAATDLGLGVLAMRPFGEGTLLRRVPSATDLLPLRRFGITTWPQALLKWIISDTRVHCAIPATSHPERMRENAAAGELPLLDDEARALIASLARE